MPDSPKDAEQLFANAAGAAKMGRYEIVRKIGQGASGMVYLGRDPFIKRQVAIKISQPTNDRGRERFFVEAQSAGRLNHPNLVAIYDVGMHGDLCYITMEYIDGDTLEDYCRPENLLSPSKAVELTFATSKALDYAHKMGVIHRDIKPSNIMLDTYGSAKITDFGIAQMTEQTSEMGIWGTPSYMSPEQLKDEPISHNTDIFSLGCVLYELLTGTQAFPGNNHFSIMYKVTNEEPVPLEEVKPDLPVILSEILKKALAKESEDRYPSCLDFSYDLRVALRGFTEAVTDDKVRDALDYVHHVPFFNNFTKEQVTELGLASTIVKFFKDSVIVAQGEIDDTFFIILSGKARISKNDHDIASISIGQCFGEMAYIGGQPRTASVIAETDCILMKISATLIDGASEAIQLLFYKNFATTLVHRLSNKPPLLATN